MTSQTFQAIDERVLMELAQDWGEASGWLGAALCILYGLAVGSKSTRILEVGVGQGGSTRALLLAVRRTGGRLTSIDDANRITAIPPDLRSDWQLIVGLSQDIAPGWREPIDFLFLDGQHTYEAVSSELDGFGRWVSKRGFIVMDDCWPEFPGVCRAFAEARGNKFLLPYGVSQSPIGGRNRTLGIIAVTDQKPWPCK